MEPKRINSENPVIKYEAKYGDTWYGIAEAKYGSKGYRQTMEIVKALKSLNNINPQDNNMQEELSMMDTITLKNGKTLKYNEEGLVDSVHNSATNKNHEINVQKRLEAEQEAAQMKAIEREKIESVNHDNTGAIGLVILNPSNYKKGVANSAEEIAVIEEILINQNPEVTEEGREKLISALKEGKLAFGFNNVSQESSLNNYEEMWSLTQQDIDLLLKYADKTSGITDNEKLLAEEVNLRREYFQNHRLVVPEEYIENKNQVLGAKAGKENSDVERLTTTDETTVTFGAKQWTSPTKWNAYYSATETISEMRNNRLGFTTVKDKGVNPYNENGELISDVDRALAEHASNVASDLSTTGQCFTSCKHALLTAGIIKNYGAIRDENGNITTPRAAIDWFQERPEMFTEIKYVQDEDGEYRKINSTDLYDLPAGYIIMYSPEEGKEFAKEAGHACITNGNGQSYADHTDRLHWEDFKKGEHGSFHVFKLNDENWEYNKNTQKLEYTGPITPKIEQDNKFAANMSYKEKNEKAAAFQKALSENKETLMRTLNITEEQFEKYKAMAQAISVVETQAGNSNETKILDALENIEFVNNLATEKYGPLSAGMTQIKASILSDDEKEILEKLGVSTGNMNNLDEPENSALATIVHIHKLEQDYPKYLTNDNIGIIKDRSELNDNEVANLDNFIKTLTTEEEWSKLLLVKDVLKGNKVATTEEEKQLIEGAKIFVDTYVEKLSKEEYVAARWNGKTRTKPSDETKTKQLNRYYDNMLQVFIDRSRIAILNGQDVEIKPAVLSEPEKYSYIGAVTYLAQTY